VTELRVYTHHRPDCGIARDLSNYILGCSKSILQDVGWTFSHVEFSGEPTGGFAAVDHAANSTIDAEHSEEV